MTSRTIAYQLTAQSNIDQVMAAITGAVQTLGAQSAAQIPKLSKELANAQAATSRAASAAEAYRQNLIKTDTALATQAATQQRVAAATERVRREAVETATAQQQLAAATARTQAAQTAAASAAQRYAEQLAKTRQAAQTSGGGGEVGGGAAALIGGLAGGAATVALGGIKAIGGAILDTAGNALTLAGNLKQSTLAFQTMLGSTAAANAELKAIRQYSDATAFTFPQLQTITAEFLGVGLGAKSALAQVRDLGDEVAGRGKSPEMLDRISLAMSQVISKGKLMGQEALQFQEAGLPVWQILAAYLHTDAAAAQALSEQGRITADVWQNALHADAAQNFAGAAERASQSWNGLLSTLGDTGQGLLTTFGSPIIQSLEPVLQGAINVLKDPQVESTIRSWGEAIGLFIQQVTLGATALAQLFGLQLPQIQAQAPVLDATAQRWNTISVSVGDVKQQTQDLKDSEDGVRAAAEATARSYDAKLARLRDAQTALDRQYDTETKIQQLHKLDADIAKNQLLGKNIFSATGRAALEKAEQEGEQRTQLIRQMGHEAEKAGFQDRITAVERAKQAAAQAAQDQIRSIEANIKGIEREAAAYDAYNRAKAAAIAAYRKQLETVNAGPGVSAGVQALGTTLGANGGILDQFTAKVRELIGPTALGAIVTLTGQVGDSFRTFGGIVGGVARDVGDLIHVLGIDTGVAGALKAAQDAGGSLFKYLLETAPSVADVVGSAFRRITDQIRLAIQGFTVGVAGLRALGPGATDADRAAFDAARSTFQATLAGVSASAPNRTTGISAGAQPGDGTRPTRTVDRSAPASVQVTVGFDESTNAMKVVRSVIKQSGDAVDQALGTVWGR